MEDLSTSHEAETMGYRVSMLKLKALNCWAACSPAVVAVPMQIVALIQRRAMQGSVRLSK